jgi:hypothetical protein
MKTFPSDRVSSIIRDLLLLIGLILIFTGISVAVLTKLQSPRPAPVQPAPADTLYLPQEIRQAPMDSAWRSA